MKQYYCMSEADVLADLQSTPDGLTAEEAARRLEQNGKNALRESARKSAFRRFLSQFADVMILVLLAAALVSAIIAVARGEYSELIDSGIILLIVVINAVIGFMQENKAEAAMAALRVMSKPYAKVIRDGHVCVVPSETVVVGDIVQLDAGDMVPADLRLIASASLKIEEAALTGESVPVEKDCEATVAAAAPLGDRINMAYSGGVVTYGRGRGVVTATGMNTEVGHIATMLSDTTQQKSPLQNQLARTAKLLSILVLGIAVVIFGAAVIRSVVNGTFGADKVIGAFMTAVAIAVAAIPEGLPAVVTIVLAIGMQKMSARRAIVKNLPAVETLGCCEIICTDKTGTLTLNRMTVAALWYDGEQKSAEEALTDPDAQTLVRTLALCNDTEENEGALVGDPTETALVRYALDRGVVYAALCNAWRRVDEMPFDSERKLMTTVNEGPEGRIAHVKGAPDILLSRCDSILDQNGQVVALDDATRDRIRAANKGMADCALRVLGAAIKVLPDADHALCVPGAAIKVSSDADHAHLEEHLTFVVLVGMIDPPRPEVKDAVRVCLEAGMRPIMITGDHRDTAAAIAREVGILREGQGVMLGSEIDRLSDEEFARVIEQYSVFARVSPENKVRIVQAYQKRGKVVAMTGDGVNDAPSIKRADIGVGMGITGTDVSKGAADIVLADDNFATIVGAVEEGRKIFANIKKAIQFLLSANIAEVLTLFIVTVFFGMEFLTPVMILWVNLVTDSLPALALGMDQSEPDIMKRPPRRVGGSLFAGRLGIDILIQGAAQAMLVLASFFIGEYVLDAAHHQVAETMAFVTLCCIQLFHSFNMRSQTHSIFRTNPFANRYLCLAFLVGVVLVVCPVLIPVLNTVFKTTALTAVEWLISIAAAVLIIPMTELQKLLMRHVQDR